jgi:hypothetical protein
MGSFDRKARRRLDAAPFFVYHDRTDCGKEIEAMDEDKVERPDGEDGKPAAEEPQEFLPRLDFSSLVYPFYTQALMKLGLLEDPFKGTTETNLEFAKRLIDLLDLLKDRTQGRLRPAEFDILDGCLSELKLHYVQKAEILKV